VRNEQQHDTIDIADRVPALLPCLIDPVLHQDDIRIVEHFSGGFKADFVLRYIRFCLRRLPLELPAKTIHVTKLYQRRNDFVGVSGQPRQLVIAVQNIEQDR
jgi:hypothetical protein